MKYILRGLGIIVICLGCRKDESAPAGLSSKFLITTPAADTTGPFVVLNGSIAAPAGNSVDIISRGVCWSINPEPKVTDSVAVSSASGTGDFVATVFNVLAHQKFYARAFYKSVSGAVFYGNTISFTRPLVPPTGTTVVSNITSTGATITCTIADNGGAAIMSSIVGILYSSTHPNPTFTLDFAVGPSTISQTFTVKVGIPPYPPLIPNTIYYYRFSLGPFSNGPVQTFKTLP